MTRLARNLYFWAIVISGALAIACGLSVRLASKRVEEPVLLLLFVGGVCFGGISLAVMLAFIHHMWDALPRQHARTSPGKAVGFLCIPLFNFYWFFQAIWGWTTDFNAYLNSRSQNGRRAPCWPAFLLCLFGVVGGTLGVIVDLAGIPYSWLIGAPNTILVPLFVFRAGGALMAVPETNRSLVRRVVIPLVALTIVSSQVVAVIIARPSFLEERTPDRDMGIKLIVVDAAETRIVAGPQRQIVTGTPLELDDAAAIREQCPYLAIVAPAVSKRLSTSHESKHANTTVIGMEPEGLPILDTAIASGLPFHEEDERAGRRVAVLGPTAAENLFGQTDPIGLQFRIGRVPFQVIGLTAPKGTDANGVDQDDFVIIPLKTAMRRVFAVDHIQMIYVQAYSAQLLNTCEEEIRELLRGRKGVGSRF